jgi:hypothetical protein
MLRTIALAVLIGFISAAASAQQKPAPSPSPAGPAPGTTAYTTKYMDALEKANRDYENLTYDPKASMDALNQAYSDAVQAYWNAETALRDEANNAPEVKAAAQARDVAKATYDRFANNPKNYGNPSEEKRLEGLWHKAIAAFVATRNRKANEIADKRYPRAFHPPKPDSRIAAQIKKYEEDKKAQEQQKAEPKKTSCVPQGGITGMTENIACQENHSGSEH